MFTLTHVYAKYYKAKTCYKNWQARWDLFTVKKKKKRGKREKKKKNKQKPKVRALSKALKRNGPDSQACSSCCRLSQQSDAAGHIVKTTDINAVVFSYTQSQPGPETDVKCWS